MERQEMAYIGRSCKPRHKLHGDKIFPQEVVWYTPSLRRVLEGGYQLAIMMPSKSGMCGSPSHWIGRPSFKVPFFCARFSNRAMSLGSTALPLKMKRVSFGGFSACRSRIVLIMNKYSDALMYLVSRFHFFNCVLYCFSLSRVSCQIHSSINKV